MRMDCPDFSKCRVLVVGDLMLDEYVRGEVDRISPEAPVQILSVTGEDHTLGGAGNVVSNLAALGAIVMTAGVVGDGPDGECLFSQFEALGLDTSGIIRENGRLTTRKTRILAAHQHVLRIDRETKQEISKETFAKILRFVESSLPAADVVVLSDYAKGFLTRDLLKHVLAVCKNHGKPVIADPKGLDFSKYEGVSLLTPNQKEAALASGIEITDDQSLSEAATHLLSETGIENLLVTRGGDGMTLFEQNRPPHHIRAEAHQVFDVSGAGDTVAAVMALGLASGLSLPESAAMANTAAGIVVAKVGTAAISREELQGAVCAFPDALPDKYKSLVELSKIVAELRGKGKRIVLTNGCFDLLHGGHIRLFSASAKLGDVLIVAIDDDASVRRLKGTGRPIIRARERVRILSALDSVGHLTIFSSADLNDLILAIRPDVLTKGANYTSETVAGRELVEELGGEVMLIPLTGNISSSEIISNIRNGKASVGDA